MRVFILLIVLSGCAPRVVEVPLPVLCFEREQMPAEVENARDRLSKDDSDGEKIKQVLIEREKLRQSDTEFRALFHGCVS